MMFLISKLVAVCLYPTTWALLLILLGIILLRRKQKRRALGSAIVAFITLWLSSTPMLVNYATRSLEAQYETRPISEYPQVEAIVVLGGTTDGLVVPRYFPEENRGSRVVTAKRLFEAQKAPLVIVCGGLPYTSSDGSSRTEADDLATLLVEWGITDDSIIRDRESRNTFENAVNAWRIAQTRNIEKVLLVTSAFHMPRAVALFRKQGFEVAPVPCSHTNHPVLFSWQQIIPNPAATAQLSRILKEYVGFATYRIAGKL